jgi:hypothetical protein
VAEKISYYAVVDSHSNRERPRTVFRRIETDDGQTDEMFSRDLTWESSPLMRGAERGDTMFDFAEITKDEANEIVARIQGEAAQAE